MYIAARRVKFGVGTGHKPNMHCVQIVAKKPAVTYIWRCETSGIYEINLSYAKSIRKYQDAPKIKYVDDRNTNRQAYARLRFYATGK